MNNYLKISLIFIMVLGGVSQAVQGMPATPPQHYKVPNYAANPNWEEMHRFPDKKEPENFDSFQQISPLTLEKQALELKRQMAHDYEELHRSGLMTGLYRKALQKEYNAKKSRLRKIEARLGRRDPILPMNPINSIARFVGPIKGQGSASSLYSQKR